MFRAFVTLFYLVFLFDQNIESESILQTARKAAGQQCIDVRIFDLYDGKGVPEGKVSLGIRFALQDAKRTLMQEDSDKARQSLTRLRRNLMLS